MTEELNRRHNLATMPTINNNGESYIVPFDIYKEGYEAYDISNWFKGRVGDNGTPFGIRWYKHGQLMDVTGMRPFIEGQVGDYTIDDSDPDNPKINMDSEASNVHVVGEVNDCQEYGVAIYRLINQTMPQSGIFYGKIGVMGTQDDGTTVMSSVDVVFKVLAGHMNMIGARKFYVSELEKALVEFQAKIKKHDQDYATLVKQHDQEFQDQTKKFNDDTKKVIDDARSTYESETKNAHDSLDALKSQIQANRDEQQNLSQHLAGTEQQIETHDVVTRPEFNNLSNQLTQQVSQMRQSGLEFYDNLDALKAAYPDGVNKLCVTLNDSHQYIYDYVNKQWLDAGAFNYGTIDPKLTEAIYRNNPDNLIANSDFNSLNMWKAGRDATDPNVYIDTENAVNGSNVAVMNGYVKEGSSNWSYLSSQSFPVNTSDNPNLSISAEVSLQGINEEAGDAACIELNLFDKNGNQTKQIYFLHNNSDFQKVNWNNFAFPVDTVKCYIAFTMSGLGQFKIRRPQANFGVTTIPYSTNEVAKNSENLLFGKHIVNWSYSQGDKHYLIDNNVTYNDFPTLHIINNDSENYYFPISPLLKVDPSSKISLAVPFKGKQDIHDSRVYVEIHQYDDYNSVENTSVRYVSNTLNADDEFNQLILNDIQLSATTNYIDVRFVTYGKVDIYIGDIALYQNKYAPENTTVINDYLLSKNHFLHYPIINWGRSSIDTSDIAPDYSLLDNQGYPTLKIKTPENRVFGQPFGLMMNGSGGFRVDSKYLSFKFMYRQNVDFKKGFVEVYIRQYANEQEKLDINKEINFILPNSDELKEIEFNNILLNSDTKIVRIGIYGEGCIDANFSNFEQIENHDFKDTKLIGEFNPSNWSFNNYQNYLNQVSIVRNANYIDVKSNITDDNYLVLASSPISVQPNTKYMLSIPALADYDSNANEVYLEIEKGSTPTEAVGHNVLSLFRFKTDGKYQNYSWNFETNKKTTYICFKLVIHKSANTRFGTISLFNNEATNITPSDLNELQNNNHVLPQLNIDSDGTINDNWTGAAFTFLDGERQVKGYLQYSIQGDSSRKYPKKNLKLKFFEDEQFKTKLKWKPKSNWTKNCKFNLKANYIDATQARNLVNSSIFAKATAITPLKFDNQAGLFKAQNLGQMEGFPVEVYFANNYYGLMTFNTKKDDKTFGMDSDNPANEVIEFENGSSGLSSQNDQLDGINYATIIQDQPTDELKTNFHNLANFINTSSDEDFKSKLGTYIDVKSVLNCILWGLYSSMWDFVKKSMILLTYDSGKTWYLTLYDMDSTWNLIWDGSKLTTEDVFNFAKPDKVLVAWDNNFYKRVYKLFKPELQEQWNYLRKNVWRNDQITKGFKKFIKSIPEEAYERDQKRWPDIPSKEITDFAQIQQSVIARGNAMDSFMEHFADSQPTQPTTPKQ